MQCQQCGYVISPLDRACPRCIARGQNNSAAPPPIQTPYDLAGPGSVPPPQPRYTPPPGAAPRNVPPPPPYQPAPNGHAPNSYSPMNAPLNRPISPTPVSNNGSQASPAMIALLTVALVFGLYGGYLWREHRREVRRQMAMEMLDRAQGRSPEMQQIDANRAQAETNMQRMKDRLAANQQQAQQQIDASRAQMEAARQGMMDAHNANMDRMRQMQGANGSGMGMGGPPPGFGGAGHNFGGPPAGFGGPMGSPHFGPGMGGGMSMPGRPMPGGN